ncbi:MAG: hypothetical protein HY808_12865 [Nitrospirae bacterium]|nr:hypothetical protein [Nitrospirota bacterium]
MRITRCRMIPIFFLAALLLFLTGGFAENNPPRNLKGPPFTDPSETQAMPENWIKQPVKYDPSAGNADLVLSLDQHLYPALLPMIQKYAKEHGLKIVVNEGTCGITSGMVERKTVDIGGFCCPPGKTDRLPGLQFHTIGIDALELLVHPDNRLDNITIGQARQIFMGEIHRWSELKSSKGEKGMDMPIQVIGRLHCKLRPGHWRLLLDKEDLFATGLQEVGAIPDMISQVALNPGAIGYEVLWNTVRYKDKGRVKALLIDGYSPENAEHLISLRYPLYRVYNLTTWEGKGVENPHAKKLVAFLLQHTKDLPKEHNIIPASLLKKTGWKFSGDEVTGEPK